MPIGVSSTGRICWTAPAIETTTSTISSKSAPSYIPAIHPGSGGQACASGTRATIVPRSGSANDVNARRRLGRRASVRKDRGSRLGSSILPPSRADQMPLDTWETVRVSIVAVPGETKRHERHKPRARRSAGPSRYGTRGPGPQAIGFRAPLDAASPRRRTARARRPAPRRQQRIIGTWTRSRRIPNDAGVRLEVHSRTAAAWWAA